MKLKKEKVIILVITLLVNLLRLMNILQIENNLANPLVMISFVIIGSGLVILVQNNIDKNYQQGKLHYQNLDVLKYLCAILILILHLRPFFNFSNPLDLTFNNIITRICVPIFFLITGYFVSKKEKENPCYIKDYIKRMIPLYLIWSLVYLPVALFVIATNLPTIQSFLPFSIPIPYLILLLVLLFPIIIFIALIYTGVYYHLWYFPAVMLSLVVLSKWKKKFSIKSLLVLSFILLVFGATETYYGVLPSIIKNVLSYYYQFFFTTRNFLFFGLFYVTLGYFLGSRKNVYSKCCFLKLIVSFFIFIFEVIFLYDTNRLNSNIFLSCIPLTYYLFICVIYLSNGLKSKVVFGKWSKYYYLIHPLVILVVSLCFPNYIEQPFTRILLVLVITHVLSLLVIKGKEKYKEMMIMSKKGE